MLGTYCVQARLQVLGTSARGMCPRGQSRLWVSGHGGVGGVQGNEELRTPHWHRLKDRGARKGMRASGIRGDGGNVVLGGGGVTGWARTWHLAAPGPAHP